MSTQRTFIFDEEEVLGKKKPKRATSSKKSAAPAVYDCTTCGLDKSCKNPKIKRYGKGKRQILLVGLCPGFNEDKRGIPFVGASGEMAEKMLRLCGVDFNNDCTRTNVLACYPGKDAQGKDKKPTESQIKCCASNLERDIQEVKPQLIICFGTEAIQAVLKSDAIGSPNVTTLHGKVLPYHKLNCWVGCSFHPSFFLHRKNDKDGIRDELIMTYDLANITSVLDQPLPKLPDPAGNICITNADEAVRVLQEFCNKKGVTAFDYECTTLFPYQDGAEILSVSLADCYERGYFIPITKKDPTFNRLIFTEQEQARILSALKDFLLSDTPKTVQNYYMEELWGRMVVGASMKNFVHDTMVSYHVVNYSSKGCTGLAFQAFENSGHEYKHEVDVQHLADASIEELCQYNTTDSRETKLAFNVQIARLKDDDKLRTFNDLFTRSLPHLMNLKQRGIRIDVAALEEFGSWYSSEMEKCTQAVRDDPQVKALVAKTGTEFNPNSPPQLSKVIYEGYKATKPERSSSTATDNETLQTLRNITKDQNLRNLLDNIFRYRKGADVQKKVTEYKGLIAKDGKIHPTFGLNTADTFRSSAAGPNAQNMYVHDKELSRFRKCVIPEPGQILLEADYKAHEARVIGMASGDVELIRQTIQKIDIHKKWGGRIVGKTMDQVTADEKYAGKNKFVFPSIYLAKAYAIAGYFNNEYPVEHFEALQAEFWREFPGVRQWQKDTLKFYNENGYVGGLSGCRIKGPLTVYQIANYPIQSSAFHILLDAFNRIDQFLIDNNFKTTIISEIHDSLLFSVEPDEFEDVVAITKEIMIQKRFDWQSVPLDIDFKMGDNWFNTEPLE